VRRSDNGAVIPSNTAWSADDGSRGPGPLGAIPWVAHSLQGTNRQSGSSESTMTNDTTSP